MRLGVAVMASVIIGAAAGPMSPAASAQQPRFLSDAEHDGALIAKGSQGCAEQRFDLARGSADGLAKEQSAAALPDADGLRQQFAQADRDGDGRISRDEWVAWFGPAYAEASKAASQPNGTDQQTAD